VGRCCFAHQGDACAHGSEFGVEQSDVGALGLTWSILGATGSIPWIIRGNLNPQQIYANLTVDGFKR
jgi:hypothetical protein